MMVVWELMFIMLWTGWCSAFPTHFWPSREPPLSASECLPQPLPLPRKPSIFTHISLHLHPFPCPFWQNSQILNLMNHLKGAKRWLKIYISLRLMFLCSYKQPKTPFWNILKPQEMITLLNGNAFSFLKKKFYSSIIMFCQFLLYSEVTVIHTHTCFFSHYPSSCSITSDYI